jgi:hypothetical protein
MPGQGRAATTVPDARTSPSESQAGSHVQEADFQPAPLALTVEAAIQKLVADCHLDLSWTSEDIWAFADDHPGLSVAELVPMVIEHIKDRLYGPGRHRNNLTAIRPLPKTVRRLPLGSRPTHQTW